MQGAALIDLLAVTLERCSVNAETAGGLALVGTPLFTDPPIFSLRSIEYALMLLYCPVQHHRNLLSELTRRLGITA